MRKNEQKRNRHGEERHMTVESYVGFVLPKHGEGEAELEEALRQFPPSLYKHRGVLGYILHLAMIGGKSPYGMRVEGGKRKGCDPGG